MMKYAIPIALLFMLAGTALGTMWLYDDPTFFITGGKPQSGTYTPADISILEIIDAPYFPLLGQSFKMNAIPVQVTNSSNTIQIGSKGTLSQSPVQVTFSGHLEDNLKYAQGKSSLRVGELGSWNSLNTPGVN
jgi:hypothetical protein